MASIYSLGAQRKMFTECVHGVRLDETCRECAAEERGRKLKREMERKLRGTRFGNLCGLKP